MKHLLSNFLIICGMTLFFSACYNEDNRIFPSCDDGIQNQEEERVDCGGPNCDPCPPSCDNGVLDWFPDQEWMEQGVDCGGPCAAEGKFCYENGIQDINPNDSTLNENWVDCKFYEYPFGHPDAGQPIPPGAPYPGSNLPDGYPECDKCNNGVHDGDNGEFITDIDGALVPVVDCSDDPLSECEPCLDNCSDGLLNGAEGPCPDCGPGCPLGDCPLTHCTDGIQNDFGPGNPRTEEGIDCGACGCPDCEDLCGDGILNGLEEAIDCGGTGTPPCQSCLSLALCGDDVQNGYETGIDCYDDNTPGLETDDLSACPSCFNLCDDGALNGNEIDVDCGNNTGEPTAPNHCQPCSDGENYFMEFEVNGVQYECWTVSVQADSIVNGGLPVPPAATIPEITIIQGGIAHNMLINLVDDNVAPGFSDDYDGDPWLLNNALNAPGLVEFTDYDGTIYSSENNTGITVTMSELNATAPDGTGELIGEFEGTLISDEGIVVEITNGKFHTTWRWPFP